MQNAVDEISSQYCIIKFTWIIWLICEWLWLCIFLYISALLDVTGQLHDWQHTGSLRGCWGICFNRTRCEKVGWSAQFFRYTVQMSADSHCENSKRNWPIIKHIQCSATCYNNCNQHFHNRHPIAHRWRTYSIFYEFKISITFPISHCSVVFNIM